MIKLNSLKQSHQFIEILKKDKLYSNYYTVFFAKNFLKESSKHLNVSFVVKKKVGNAVLRNKIKRRLRSGVQQMVKKNVIDLNYTYVFFGKKNASSDKYKLILEELLKTFNKIKKFK
ncbi:MAG: ribonuclease P protein component [Candidatus Pelagibacter sp. TMED64]|nr:ribonuclease P protein component [Candidatus Pelagibacter sp.]OUU67716.1 MAG: ribonuclease P protein component [Candidatus Pelagibacter sp. TMED64]|tara:strand:- start:425 stop:775 length:351 start_codon:yes stop_codon:yes gene_type:complete